MHVIIQTSCKVNWKSVLQTKWKHFPLTNSLPINFAGDRQEARISTSFSFLFHQKFAEAHIHFLTKLKHIDRFGDSPDSEHLLTAVWIQAAAFLTWWFILNQLIHCHFSPHLGDKGDLLPSPIAPRIPEVSLSSASWLCLPWIDSRVRMTDSIRTVSSCSIWIKDNCMALCHQRNSFASSLAEL